MKRRPTLRLADGKGKTRPHFIPRDFKLELRRVDPCLVSAHAPVVLMTCTVGLISVLQTRGVHNVPARGGSLLLYCILHTPTLLCPSTFKIRGINKARVCPCVLFCRH